MVMVDWASSFAEEVERGKGIEAPSWNRQKGQTESEQQT